MSGFVYVAHPIDQVPNGKVRQVVTELKVELKRKGLGSYDPGLAFTVGDGQEVSKEIRQVNNWALGRCAGLIAILPAGVPSVGTPMEIERARHNDIPVLVITDALDKMWSLDGFEQVYVQDLAYAAHRIDILIKQAQERHGQANRVTPLPVQRTGEIQGVWEGQLPVRHYDDDAGLDLVVSEPRFIAPGQFVDVPCGIAVELPPWAWGFLVGRSSTIREKGLQVQPGIIDTGYRGELFTGVYNPGSEVVEVKAGERLAQLILIANETRLHRPVWGQLSPHARGEQGFGSTGR